MPEALAGLGARGVNRLMVEGGAALARAFLEAGVVDEIHLFRAPGVIGQRGVTGLDERALQAFTIREQESLGRDRLTVYEARK